MLNDYPNLEWRSAMNIAEAWDRITADDVLLELKRVLKSRIFSQSVRLCRFLRFTVEYAMEGKANLLKEYLIGCEVYDRTPPYDPTVDSIVRTEARRLRGKLKQYYETEGRYNPVRINYEVGSYMPSFVQVSPDQGMACLPGAADRAMMDGTNEVLVGVAPFLDLAQTTLSAAFARGLSQEIAQVLMRRGMCSVMESNSGQSGNRMLLEERFPLSPDFRLEGSIREADGSLSVMVKLIRAERASAA
jgi:TolB-like protein